MKTLEKEPFVDSEILINGLEELKARGYDATEYYIGEDVLSISFTDDKGNTFQYDLFGMCTDLTEDSKDEADYFEEQINLLGDDKEDDEKEFLVANVFDIDNFKEKSQEEIIGHIKDVLFCGYNKAKQELYV